MGPLIQAAIGTGMGMLANEFAAGRGYARQKKLQGLQIKGMKEMADYNQRKQMEMWEATNYAPQVAQLKKAGLNPGLLYGMGGAGAATVGGGASTSVTGATANQGGGEITAMAGMGLQMGMMEAQKKVLESQAAKNQAEADKLKGVDTQEAQTRIDSLLQGIDNARQQHEIQKLEIRLRNIENYEKQASQAARLEYIEYQTRMALKQLDIVENEAFISKETMASKIKIVQQEAANAVLRNALTQAQTDKTRSDIQINQEQIKKWANEIAIAWNQQDLNKLKLTIEQFTAEFNANHPGMWNSLGRIVEDGVESLSKIFSGENRKYLYKVPETK